MKYILLLSSVFSSDRNPNQPLGTTPGSIIRLTSATNFCFFLPPAPNLTIAVSEGYPLAEAKEAEKWAIAFCTTTSGNPNGAKTFYDGFITSAEFSKNDSYISVSGTMDATKAGIPLDGGGYYDLDHNVNSPPGGICENYDSFFNMVNPVDGVICCKGIENCKVHLAVILGCKGLVPGRYTPGYFPGGTLSSNGITLNGVTAGNTGSTGTTGSTGSTGVPGKSSASPLSFVVSIFCIGLTFISILSYNFN